MIDYKKYLDKDLVQDRFTFISFFIAIYERMTDYVESQVKSLLCDISIDNGEIIYKESKRYKDEIKNRIIDEQGNKNKLKASFHWLLDTNIISKQDYDDFLEMKKIRNEYAHELIEKVLEDDIEKNAELFVKMIALYKKITRNWFIEVEASIQGIDLTDAILDEIQSADCFLFQIIFDVLYRDKGKEYIDLFDKYGVKHEV